MALKTIIFKVAVDGFTSTLISVCIAWFPVKECLPGEPSLIPVLVLTTCCFKSAQLCAVKFSRCYGNDQKEHIIHIP